MGGSIASEIAPSFSRRRSVATQVLLSVVVMQGGSERCKVGCSKSTPAAAVVPETTSRSARKHFMLAMSCCWWWCCAKTLSFE